MAETSSGIELAWEAPSDTGLGGAVTGYNIYRWDATNGWLEAEDDTGSTDTDYTDTDTLEVGWNWWAVRAINADGEGEWSETSGVTTATNVPGVPGSLYAVETAATGVYLAWSEPRWKRAAPPVTGYRIWRLDGSSGWSDNREATPATLTPRTATQAWQRWGIRNLFLSRSGFDNKWYW